jgi:hypothetical protein
MLLVGCLRVVVDEEVRARLLFAQKRFGLEK